MRDGLRQKEVPVSAWHLPDELIKHTDLSKYYSFITTHEKQIIGEGAFGTVFLIDPPAETARIKHVIKVSDTNSKMAKKMLHFEKEILALIGPHPYIIEVLGDDYLLDEDGQFILPTTPCMAMKFYSHGDLFEALFGENKRSIGHSLDYKLLGEQIATGLDHLHKKHIVHRDLKPENIMLSVSNTPVIGDFGLSVISTLEKPHPLTTAGTPLYFAPEILKTALKYKDITDSSPIASPAQDIYAFGIILLLMMRHELPADDLPAVFNSHNPNKMRRALKYKEKFSFLSLYRRDFPKINDPMMEAVVRSACHPEVSERSSAAQLEKLFSSMSPSPTLFMQKRPCLDTQRLFSGCVTTDAVEALRDQLNEEVSKKFESLTTIYPATHHQRDGIASVRDHDIVKQLKHNRFIEIFILSKLATHRLRIDQIRLENIQCPKTERENLVIALDIYRDILKRNPIPSALAIELNNEITDVENRLGSLSSLSPKIR